MRTESRCCLTDVEIDSPNSFVIWNTVKTYWQYYLCSSVCDPLNICFIKRFYAFLQSTYIFDKLQFYLLASFRCNVPSYKSVVSCFIVIDLKSAIEAGAFIYKWNALPDFRPIGLALITTLLIWLSQRRLGTISVISYMIGYLYYSLYIKSA